MRYESSRTERGNIGVSYASQADADKQAAQMDANGCRNCTNCRNCRNCTDCRNCTNCTNCSGVLLWQGSTAVKLFSMNGLRWPIAVSDTHMQIGCQNHSHEDWRTFTDSQIGQMAHAAIEFWKQWKPTLMAACAWKAGGGE